MESAHHAAVAAAAEPLLTSSARIARSPPSGPPPLTHAFSSPSLQRSSSTLSSPEANNTTTTTTTTTTNAALKKHDPAASPHQVAPRKSHRCEPIQSLSAGAAVTVCNVFDDEPLAADTTHGDLHTVYLDHLSAFYGLLQPGDDSEREDPVRNASSRRQNYRSHAVHRMSNKSDPSLLISVNARCVDAHIRHMEVNSFCEGRTPLMEAADLGEVSRVNLLLNMGADPNLTDAHGYTALMSAVQHSLPIALALLRANANPTTARKVSGSTALHSLMRRNFSQPLLRLEVLTLMLAIGAARLRDQMDANTLCTQLEAQVQLINLQDKSGSTLLHEAIFSDNRTFFLVKFLLLNGIDLQTKDKNGRTAYDCLKLVHEAMVGEGETLSLNKAWEEYSEVERLLILLRPSTPEEQEHADPRFSVHKAPLRSLHAELHANTLSWLASSPHHRGGNNSGDELIEDTHEDDLSLDESEGDGGTVVYSPPLRVSAPRPTTAQYLLERRRSARQAPLSSFSSSQTDASTERAPSAVSNTPAAQTYRRLFSSRVEFVPDDETATFLPGMRGTAVQQFINADPSVLQLGVNSLRCVITSAQVLWLREGHDPMPILLTLFNDLLLITSPLRRRADGRYLADFFNVIILMRLYWFDLPDFQYGTRLGPVLNAIQVVEVIPFSELLVSHTFSFMEKKNDKLDLVKNLALFSAYDPILSPTSKVIPHHAVLMSGEMLIQTSFRDKWLCFYCELTSFRMHIYEFFEGRPVLALQLDDVRLSDRNENGSFVLSFPEIGHEYRAQPLEDVNEWYDAMWRRIRGLKVVNHLHKDGTSAFGTPLVKLEDDWVALDTPSPIDHEIAPIQLGRTPELLEMLIREEPKVKHTQWPASPPAAHHVRATPPPANSAKASPRMNANASASKRMYQSTPL